MSKKDIRKKYKDGETMKRGILYRTGRWLKWYFIKKTTKRKHKYK